MTGRSDQIGLRRGGRWARGRGFSFTEVLFAVMVLAIGFIMVAAMFPVTIRQQQTTLEETIASTTGKAALGYMQKNDLLRQLPVARGDSRQLWQTCPVYSFAELPEIFKTLTAAKKKELMRSWESITGNLVLPENPGIAWVPLYRRPDNESYVAQIYIIVARNRNRPHYETVNTQNNDPTMQGKDVFRIADPEQYATLEPKPVFVTTIKRASPEAADRIRFEPDGDRTEIDYALAAVEGAYVIIAEATEKDDEHTMNGRVFQLGARVDTGDPEQHIYDLVPGNDFDAMDIPVTRDADDKPGAKAYILGRGLRDPTMPFHIESNPFEGPAQDIGIYTAFVKIPQVAIQ